MRVPSLILIASSLCAACGDDGGDTQPDATPIADAPDANNGGDAPIDGPAPLGPFGAPTMIELPPSKSREIDDDPSMTSDRLELYINRSSDIYVARRAAVGDAWGTPVRIDELSTSSNETTPDVSGNGLSIAFASDRPGTAGGTDIYVSTRASRTAAWDAPVRIAEVSSSVDDTGGVMTEDGLAMALASLRDGNLELYTSTRASTTAVWGAPVRVTTTPMLGEQSPMLSQDKLSLYFDANAGNTGGTREDIFVMTRTSTTGSFGAATRVTELDTASDDSDVSISPDGHHAVFVSDRATMGVYRYYETSR